VGRSAAHIAVRSARKRWLLVLRLLALRGRARPLLQQPKQRAAVASGAKLRRHLADHACAAKARHKRLTSRPAAAQARAALTPQPKAGKAHAPGCSEGGTPPGAARMMKRVPSSCISV
jgi:hypothetical protein